MSPARSNVNIGDLIEAGLAKPGDRWIISHRTGETSTARVTKDGALRIGREKFWTPSQAASATLGGTPVNGWRMWKYDDGGTWRSVAELREQLQPRARK